MDYTTGEYRGYQGVEEVAEAILRLHEANRDGVLIGHGIRDFDIPVLERLSGLSFDHTRLIDTVYMSRGMFGNKLEHHGLRTWGELLECPKGFYKDFDQWNDDGMAYLERDVELSAKVFTVLFELLDEVKK